MNAVEEVLSKVSASLIRRRISRLGVTPCRSLPPNLKMTRRGFLFTLDAFIALLLMTGIMLMVLSADYSDRTFSSLSMRSFSMDMLASYEKSGLFAQSLSDQPRLRRALNSLPPGICAQITIMNSSNVTVLDAMRQGCPAQQDDVYTFYRTFYAEDELYLARSKVWPK